MGNSTLYSSQIHVRAILRRGYALCYYRHKGGAHQQCRCWLQGQSSCAWLEAYAKQVF